MDLHDPGMDTQSISALFDSLKVDLVPIVQQILQSKKNVYLDFQRIPGRGPTCAKHSIHVLKAKAK